MIRRLDVEPVCVDVAGEPVGVSVAVAVAEDGSPVASSMSGTDAVREAAVNEPVPPLPVSNKVWSIVVSEAKATNPNVSCTALNVATASSVCQKQSTMTPLSLNTNEVGLVSKTLISVTSPEQGNVATIGPGTVSVAVPTRA